MANLNFIKSKEARIGAIIVLSIIIIIIGFNYVKSRSEKRLRALSAELSSTKLGVVESIRYNEKNDNYIISIVFKGNAATDNYPHGNLSDTVTITVEKHLLKPVLKNYEIPENKKDLQAIMESGDVPQVDKKEVEKGKTTPKTTPAKPTEKKATVVKTEPKTRPVASIGTNNDIEFRIQFYMTKKFVKTDDPLFDRFKEITYYVDNDYYKYTTGKAKDFNAAKTLLEGVLIAYPEAFIVAFNNDDRISVLDAKKIIRSSKKD